MKNRIRELMEMDGLNATEFSKKVKINSSVVSNILNAKNQPSFDVIQKIILAYPEVDVSWLMTGRGDMFGGEMAPEEESLFELEPDAPVDPSLFAIEKDLSTQARHQEASQALENALQPTRSSIRMENAKEKGRKKPSKDRYQSNNQELIIEEKPQKKIQKIIIVYQDHTFEEILPQD